jgi:hypothetical protein
VVEHALRRVLAQPSRNRDADQTVHFDVRTDNSGTLYDVFDENHSRADASGQHEIRLPGYGHRWLRVGGPDTTPWRSADIE